MQQQEAYNVPTRPSESSAGDAIAQTARIPPPRVQPIQVQKVIKVKSGNLDILKIMAKKNKPIFKLHIQT
jgi:hypothetical protein